MLQEVIQSLHLHIDSLKQQVGSLLDESEAKDRMMQAMRQQVEARDKRIKALVQQIAEVQGQLTDASSALTAVRQDREQELAEKDAELAALKSSRQQPLQQSQHPVPHKLQRVGSVASTSHRYKQATHTPLNTYICNIMGSSRSARLLQSKLFE